jgi:hypothetical protein
MFVYLFIYYGSLSVLSWNPEHGRSSPYSSKMLVLACVCSGCHNSEECNTQMNSELLSHYVRKQYSENVILCVVFM